VADPKTHLPPHICYPVKSDSSLTKSVRINRKEPTKLGSAGIPPPWVGR